MQPKVEHLVSELVMVMVDAAIAADIDPSRGPMWRAGVEIMRMADGAESVDEAAALIASAAALFRMVADGTGPGHVRQTIRTGDHADAVRLGVCSRSSAG